MAENIPDLTVFKLSPPPSPAEMIRSFRDFPELAAPVALIETPEPGLYTIPGYKDGESMLLPAFTDPKLLNPPFCAKATLPFLNILFHAPTADTFAFNPPLPQARFAAAMVRLNKKQLSAVIGMLQTPPAMAENPDIESAAKREADLGNLHRANFFAELCLAGNPGRPPMGFYAGILIGLGLFQEAYDYVSAVEDPEFYCYLAEIHRRTGDMDAARQALEKVPAGSPFSDKRDLELAWISFESGDTPAAREAFKRLSEKSFLKTEGLFGLGAALAADALNNKNRKEMDEALKVFNTALQTPSPLAAQIFFHLGGICFRAGNYTEAAACYRSSVNLWPAVQSKANLCLAFIKTGNIKEAAAFVNEIALTDLPSSACLAAELPRPQSRDMLKTSRGIETSPRDTAPARTGAQPPVEQPGPAAIKPQRSEPAPAAPPAEQRTAFIKPQRAEPVQAGDAPAQVKPAVIKTRRPGFTAPPPAARPPAPSPEQPPPIASLQRAEPRISTRIIKPFDSAQSKPPAAAEPPAPPPAQPPVFRPIVPDSPAEDRPGPARAPISETFKGAVDSLPLMTAEESRRDEFIGRAFKLASEMEDSLNRKVYFNTDGLTEVEKKLRMTFLQSRPDTQTAIEIITDSAAFLCYTMQERLKFRLIKFTDFDPWGWPMMIGSPKRIVTYPIVRLWQLLWEETLPGPGWLSKYYTYVQDELESQTPGPQGTEAVLGRTQSSRDRLLDAETEHKRIIILISTLSETNGIELGRAGLTKLESAIKSNFRPDLPPTTDGWKLLRCYGHILAEILIKDLKAAWYNVDGNDGLWSMQMPWQTFVFPLGKVYKIASRRESLTEYYDALLEDKMRYSGR